MKSWPPSLSRRDLARVPRDLRDDCRQVAWQAWYQRRCPASAVRNLLRRARRDDRRERPFSQLHRLPGPVIERLGVF